MITDSNAWGKKVMEKALEFANYQWIARDANALHGLDSNGRYEEISDNEFALSSLRENMSCPVPMSPDTTPADGVDSIIMQRSRRD